MRKMVWPAAWMTMAVVLAGAPATVGTSEPMAWRYAHPEAQVLAGADFRKLAETADGQKLRAQFAAALGAPLLTQAERLLMSSVMDSGGRRSDILVLSGTFALSDLRKMAMREGAKMLPYKGLEIAAPAGAVAADPHLAWVAGLGGGTTVLIGTRPAIQAAAERAKAHVESLSAVNPLFARARDLAPQYAVWVTCETVPQGMGPKALDQLTGGGGEDVEAGEVNGFDVGVGIGAAASLQMWLWTSSESTAELVLKKLQAGVGEAAPFVLSPWLRELKGTIEESTLVLGAPMAAGTVAERVGPILAAFALPVDVKPVPSARPAEMQIAVRAKVESNVPMTGMPAMTTPVTAVPVAAAAVAPVVPAAPAAAPKKMFVRIEGLDDGVKDIPYTAKP